MPTTHELFRQIWDLAPPGSPDPADHATLSRLADLTDELIAAHGGPAALAVDPLAEGRRRTLPLDEAAVAAELAGRRVLVTGGAGGVGRALVAALPRFGPSQVTSVDLALPARRLADAEVVADVADPGALRLCFERARPEVVFHLAAQRLPGLAEHQVRRTVAVNVLGAQHVVDLAAAFGVRRLAHASTGKAARYHTPDVYAGSKKIAEWITAEAGQRGGSRVALARFTHIVENSPVSADLDRKLAAGLLRIHDPHRVMYVQSMSEAVRLLLTGVTAGGEGAPVMVTVRDLGWPVDVLRLALHRVVRSGQRAPLCFAGLPAGYERHPFLGQLDWSTPDSPHPMVNAVEAPATEPDPTGTMLRTAVTPPPGVAATAVGRIRAALAGGRDERDERVRRALTASVSAGCAGVFAGASLDLLLKVLLWGAHPAQLGGVGVEELGAVVPLLMAAIAAKLDRPPAREIDQGRLVATLRELAGVGSLRAEAVRLAGLLGLPSPVEPDGVSALV